MTTAYWCVLAAGLLPYVAVVVAKAGVRYDNRNPRGFLAGLQGYRARANHAQLNSFEAFPLFAAVVIIAHQLGAEQGRLDMLALGFIAARVAYLGAYLADKASIRSLFWMVGLVCAVAILVTAA